MKVACILACLLASAVAEPPISRQYLPPGGLGDARGISSQYGARAFNGGDLAADNAPSAAYGAPRGSSQRSFGGSDSLSTEYGVPAASERLGGSGSSRSFGGSRPTSTATFVPSGSSSSARFGASSSVAPASRLSGASATSDRFGAASVSTQYGAPSAAASGRFGAAPSPVYGVPASRLSGASATSDRFGAASVSTQYGAPSAAASGRFGAAPSPVYGVPASGYSLGPETEDPLAEPANYQFDFEVRDEESGAAYGQRESRQLEAAQGSYHVLLPDGRTLVVDYEADEDGYHPSVRYEQPASGYQRGSGGPY